MHWVIDPAKLSSYPLDIRHVNGGPKARFFLGRGFRPAQPDTLAVALLAHPRQAALRGRTRHTEGHKLVYECSMHAADGSRPAYAASGSKRMAGSPPA